MSDYPVNKDKAWASYETSYSQIRIDRHDLLKRLDALLDYGVLHMRGLFVTPLDSFKAMQLFHRLYELEYAVTANPALADREQRKLVSQRLSEVKACVEAVCISDTPHPVVVSKFLCDLSELSRDLEAILNRELLLGIHLEHSKEAVGGSEKLRSVLEVHCPSFKWNEAQRLMANAMDSPLAAKQDEEFEIWSSDDEQK